MDIIKMLSEQISDPRVLAKISQKIGAEPEKIAGAAQLSLPALLQGLSRNASTESGAASLLQALSQHEDDDVEDIDGFFDRVDTTDGKKIVQHIFSGNKERVGNNLAQKTGLQSDQVMGLMSQLAPLVLGSLGKQKKQQNLDASGLSGILSGIGGKGNGGGLMGMVNDLLDSDNDGSAIDDIGNVLGRLLKK